MSLGRQQGQDARQFVSKTQVQQAVCFVQHQGGDGGEAQGIVVNQIEQAAGGGDHDVGPPAQTHHLRVDGNATKRDHGFRRMRQALRKPTDDLAHLRGQLPRRYQNQHPHAARRFGGSGAGLQALQQRQGERRRLA